MGSIQESAETQYTHFSNTVDESLPLVVCHQTVPFMTNVKQGVQSQFRTLELEDPSYSSLAQSVRALVCIGASPITVDTFRKFPSLELVVATSSGLNHIDFPECKRRGVKVTGIGDAFADDVADYAVCMLVDVLRRVSAADRFVRTGLWPVKSEFPLGSKVKGKRVGIVGLGGIGSEIAKRLKPFGCIISYNSRRKKAHVPFPYYSNVKDLATNSDALIVCCALTKETHHLINKDVLTALGQNGVIVNVGRGALIDEKELVQFLAQGQIGGAGLDVFEYEPQVPEKLFGLDNVLLSHHRGACTPEAMAGIIDVAICNLEAFFANKPLLSPIMPEY